MGETDKADAIGRLEGRLFAVGGTLYMVLETDRSEGFARVSFRDVDVTQVIEMPLAAVAQRVGNTTGLKLDNLNGVQSTRRLTEEEGGWYFSTRKGREGPFDSQLEAGRRLGRYVLSMQTTNTTHRKNEQDAA